jgi:hypothetical protein
MRAGGTVLGLAIAPGARLPGAAGGKDGGSGGGAVLRETGTDAPLAASRFGSLGAP